MPNGAVEVPGGASSSSSSRRGWGSAKSAQGALPHVPAAPAGKCDAKVLLFIEAPQGDLEAGEGKHVGCELSCPPAATTAGKEHLVTWSWLIRGLS